LGRYGDRIRQFWQDLLEHQGVERETATICAYGLTSMVSDVTTAYAVQPRRQLLARETLKKLLMAAIGALSTRPTDARPDVHVVSYLPQDKIDRVPHASAVPPPGKPGIGNKHSPRRKG